MMNTGKTSVLVLALCASFGTQAQPASGTQAQWVKFSSSEAPRYAVSFPAQPKESQREDKTPEGRAVVTHFQAVEDAKGYFAMSWVQMPRAPRNKLARDRILDSAAAGALKSIPGGVLLSKRRVSVGRAVGLDYVVDAPKEAQRLRQRVFLVGDRLVQQTYSGPTGSETDAGVKRFIASLRFLN